MLDLIIMKKTLELLKNKEIVKKSLENSFYATAMIVGFFAVMEKLGIKKWRTYDDPLTWTEFIYRLPYLALWALLIYVFVFFVSLHFKEEPIVICTKCLKSFFKKNTKDDLCPDCNSRLEKINGVYDRHPELKGKNIKNVI